MTKQPIIKYVLIHNDKECFRRCFDLLQNANPERTYVDTYFALNSLFVKEFQREIFKSCEAFIRYRSRKAKTDYAQIDKIDAYSIILFFIPELWKNQLPYPKKK